MNNILPLFHKKTTVGNIVTLALNGYLRQNIFTFNGKTKRNQLQSDHSKNKTAYSWFQESVFIGNCCYSNEGDTIYVANQPPQFDSQGMPVDTELISYEEGIRFRTGYFEDVSAENISISRYNYKDTKSVWATRIVPPFDVTSDAKRVKDFKDRDLIIFQNDWGINWALDHNSGLVLSGVGKSDE